MMKYITVICLFLFGCTGAEKAENSADKKLRIVCTTGMIGDAVSNIVDSTCVVHTLMGPGTDPHLFKPTKASLDLLSEADIVIANGLHLEGRMQDILEKMARTKQVFFMGDAISKERLIYGDDAHSIPDPHLWFDVDIWRMAVDTLSAKLVGIDVPMNGAEKYSSELAKLDAWAKTTMAKIPEQQRILLTAHDAFSYFGRAYSTEVIALQGISTVAEYGIRDVTDMVNTIVDRRIKAVFVESSISARSIEAVMAGANEKGFDIVLGGTLYSDALGSKESGADTYVNMVRHNVRTISKALK